MERNINDADQRAAERLKRIWLAYRKEHPEATQAYIAEKLGWNTQAAVSQYMNGRIALGLEATVKFAQFFGVPPEDIRPDLKNLAMPTYAKAAHLVAEDAREGLFSLAEESGEYSAIDESLLERCYAEVEEILTELNYPRRHPTLRQQRRDRHRAIEVVSRHDARRTNDLQPHVPPQQPRPRAHASYAPGVRCRRAIPQAQDGVAAASLPRSMQPPRVCRGGCKPF